MRGRALVMRGDDDRPVLVFGDLSDGTGGAGVLAGAAGDAGILVGDGGDVVQLENAGRASVNADAAGDALVSINNRMSYDKPPLLRPVPQAKRQRVFLKRKIPRGSFNASLRKVQSRPFTESAKADCCGCCMGCTRKVLIIYHSRISLALPTLPAELPRTCLLIFLSVCPIIRKCGDKIRIGEYRSVLVYKTCRYRLWSLYRYLPMPNINPAFAYFYLSHCRWWPFFAW